MRSISDHSSFFCLGQSESLAVRRTSFLFDIHNCVLREFLIELERLFVNDLSPFMVNKEEYHIQLKGISDDGTTKAQCMHVEVSLAYLRLLQARRWYWTVMRLCRIACSVQM